MTTSQRRNLKRQSGQSVIIAIAVLFILAFLAAVFIILIARNLERTARATDITTADYFAQAGIKYADQMLTTSVQGADWRPPLQFQLSAAPSGADEAAQYALGSAALPSVASLDPDKFWLQQGFSRYNLNGGRFLLRVTFGAQETGSVYDNASTQTGKYIKIESIGRTGTVIADDPTTFTPQPIRLHAELVAYKPIGLVDYSRFITNVNQRSDVAALGVPSQYGDLAVQPTGASTSSVVAGPGIFTPGVYDFRMAPNTLPAPASTTPFLYRFPLVTTYGTPIVGVSSTLGQGGSLRCNGNLRLYGVNTAYLNATNGDDWEIAGNLTFDGYNSTSDTTQTTLLNVVGTDTTAATYPLQTGIGPGTPSNSASGFNSIGGLIRDGSGSNDIKGFPRGVKRLNPPSLDTLDPSTKLNKYEALVKTGTKTVASGSVVTTQGGPFQQESLASPATVFIDNSSDIQEESANVVTGAYTLRDDWVNRTSNWWEGGIYTPPGAQIVFGPIYLNVGTSTPYQTWGFTITRSDSNNGSTPTWDWTDPSGTPDSSTTPTYVFVYSKSAPVGYVADPNNPVVFLGANNGGNGDAVASGAIPSNDILIYAEGNVRVRGVISDPNTVTQQPDHHVTIVSGGIAYVDGNLLKGGQKYANPSYDSKSSIALLAESYVCVNTTQFLAGQPDFLTNATDVPERTADPPTLSFSSGQELTEYFDFPPVTYAGYTGDERLFLAQYSGEPAVTSSGDMEFDTVGYGAAVTASTATYSPTIASPGIYQTMLQGSAVTPIRGYVNLLTSFAPTGAGTPFVPPAGNGYTAIAMTFAKDAQSTADYQIAKAAILPSDVRIEAILYAQNNSFFVIPGESFNNDASDTLLAAESRPRPTTGAGSTAPFWPFFGQPIDMKITVDGSVIENLPADIGDQSSWMLNWGWIPDYHGTGGTGGTPELAAHGYQGTSANTRGNTTIWTPPAGATSLDIRTGLNITYDPNLATAYSSTTAAGATAGSPGAPGYVRLDPYGRPLPYAPNLPVSPDLLYSGQTTGNSLLQ